MHNIKILRGEYTVTKQEIYNTIVSLTAEIKATDVGTKLFEAAKVDGQKVKEVAETFMSEYPELYQKMCSFASKFNEFIEANEDGIEGEIFGSENDESKEIRVFDTNVINASSFFTLTFLTDINVSYLFDGTYIELEADKYVTDDSAYLDALEEESDSSDLPDFLGIAAFSEEELECLEEYGYEYSNIYDLLADVFAGKLEEYVE